MHTMPRKAGPTKPSKSKGIRFPEGTVLRIGRYAETTHNSFTGAVVYLCELALATEEARLRIGPTTEQSPPGASTGKRKRRAV